MTPFARRSALAAAALVSAFATIACMRATASAEGAILSPRLAGPPKLVLFITIDQFRGDYLSRFPGQLTKGLARLSRGAWFTNGFQDHAITETAPGHASTMSGRFPRSTGIVANSIGVVDPNYKLLVGSASEVGASPFRFKGTTLYDWIAARDKRSRAFSVSRKDRGAILPIGSARQNVYWYSTSGAFTTSNYYRDTLPEWVVEFNARRLPQRYAGTQWTLRHEPSFYSEPDTVAYENRGANNVFPHSYSADSTRAASDILASPAMDSVTALFALEGMRRLEIGAGPQTDVMAVSFSATDYVGHTYGPDSREAHENLLRLDETIGWFLDSLFKLRDSSTVVVALTGDHGISPIPELARERGEATGDQGMRVNLSQQVSDVRAGLQRAGVDPGAFVYDTELAAIDRAALGKKLKADSILDAFIAAAKQVRGVARVDRVSAVYKADPALDPIARRWSHQLPQNTAVDLVLTLTRYSYWGSGIVATHGSPYDQDAFVPIIFYGAGVKPGKYTLFARTVDMAPTLAAIVGVKALEPLDGRALLDAIAK